MNKPDEDRDWQTEDFAKRAGLVATENTWALYEPIGKRAEVEGKGEKKTREDHAPV